MMQKYYLWALKHPAWARVLVFVLATGVFFIPFFLLSLLGGKPLSWEPFFCAAVGLVWAWVLPTWCVHLLTMPQIETMHHRCDPYPLLDVTRALMELKLPARLRQVAVNNYCGALQETGQYNEALELLSGLNMHNAPLVHKAAHYNNLGALCHRMGNYAQADQWDDLLMQMYRSIPEGAVKNQLNPAIRSAAAARHLRRGEYEQAIAALNTEQAPNLYSAVSSALLDAQAQLGLGRYQTAADRLQYVIAHGNRLHAVTEARALLAQCTAPNAE